MEWASVPGSLQPKQVSPKSVFISGHGEKPCFAQFIDCPNSVIASFRSLLPEDYEFVFLDGIVECEAAPGVDGFYPGPYLCWYNTPTTSKVARAHKYVLDFVRANGPFDGVMGFSQVRPPLVFDMLSPWLTVGYCRELRLRHQSFCITPLPIQKPQARGDSPSSSAPQCRFRGAWSTASTPAPRSVARRTSLFGRTAPTKCPST